LQSLQVTPTMLIRKARRRKLWQPPHAVLLTSIGWCVLHITTHRSSIIINWLPVHRRIRMSYLEWRHPHRPCCSDHCRGGAWFNAHATIVVRLVISLRNVRHRGRWMCLDLRVICHTPFRDSGNEASIRVPRMCYSHI
jgi:hypothetical protein